MAGDGRAIRQHPSAALRSCLRDAIQLGVGVSFACGALITLGMAVFGFELAIRPDLTVIAVSLTPIGVVIAGLYAARLWQLRDRLQGALRHGQPRAATVVEVEHALWGGKPSLAVRVALDDEPERKYELRMADRPDRAPPRWAEVGALVDVLAVEDESYAIARAAGAPASSADRLVRRWERIYVCGLAHQLQREQDFPSARVLKPEARSRPR